MQDNKQVAPRERLIVALDLPSVKQAEAMIERLGEAVVFYKLGYQLIFAGGLPLAQSLIKAGKRVFLDMKLHDIGNTVGKGVEGIATMGMTFLTVHAYPQTMKAAVEAAKGSQLRILAVTVLTSYNEADVAEAGYAMKIDALVAAKSRQAEAIGVDGIVCSGAEAAGLRRIIAPKTILVTPGIRPAHTASDDQKRIMTPAQAIHAGSDYLVVGRPIVAASDPKAVAEAVVAEIATARR